MLLTVVCPAPKTAIFSFAVLIKKAPKRVLNLYAVRNVKNLMVYRPTSTSISWGPR